MSETKGIITQLDELTASQIAAGEVVERPVSVVKELAENAIDAGAKHITVRLAADADLKYIEEIQVVDDGCGMVAADLPLAFGRHATSKLHTAADLAAIQTLGFRGEALPSIAAVSRVEVLSTARGALSGYAVQAADGKVKLLGETALAEGTKVTVRDLFYNTPARKKFLKSYATETGQISRLIGELILSRPDIAFLLQIDGRTVLRSPGGGSAEKAVLAVYGAEVLSALRPVAYQAGGVGVAGYASLPPFARSSRRYYHFFVNGRLVKSPELNSIVDTAYLSLLPEGKYPLVVLYLTLPAGAVDVNVHPAKTEIRFNQLKEVKDAVLLALRRALALKAPEPEQEQAAEDGLGLIMSILGKQQAQPEPLVKAAEPAFDLSGDIVFTPEAPSDEKELPDAAALRRLSGEGMTELLKDSREEAGFAQKLFENLLKAAPGKKQEYRRDDGEWLAENFGVTYLDEPQQNSLFAAESNLFLALRPLGQLNNSYIIAALNEDLYIIDQHAAHERILYEEFSLAFGLDSRETSLLAVPVTVDVGALNAELLLANITRLADFGFVLEHFGGNQFVIRGVPLWYVRGSESDYRRKSRVYDNDIAGFFLGVLDMLLETAEDEQLDIARLNKLELFTKACKSAIKANEHLNGQEIAWLLHNLAECDKPQTCPHGRPTFFKITDAEIRRRFMRSEK